MSWVYLCLAIFLEVAGTISMKLSEGFTKLTPSILLAFFYIGSLSFLTLALKTIEVSVAYAIWSGIGILIITFIGVFFFNESFSLLKVVSILLIIIGVITLNFTVSHDSSKDRQITEKQK
ncbi:DMT family transporter [Peribacillus huizhouensis]|uniref:Small multidrug resistance pump n=1 Tax=Peribacillus huizhouensis TaxID=1501239 RepID=A0ABR6CVW7_9BACI|nr:multidrug efflux SMR transporter [Peribacillus huizhouensis]MBA9028755.1 small multidrug resistance pump [Peribacillus huizhouensis]